MPIIKTENISKKYIIGHQGKGHFRYTNLRDVIGDSIKSIFNKSKDDDTSEEIWALKDISFEINQGDRVGIIGKNGAGKTTLLKILSRITEPTTGYFTIKGKTASLLEVGTGFHPELTGRENIYLNGAILGMKKAEIKKKFDEIVSFAEIEKFLDTPVKRYSSGMYMRLAFAVAAHLDPDILFIDEVLAVGDAEFQKKCLFKMENISKQEGRTILFVSHNMNAIETLCQKAILLEKGVIKEYSDDVRSVIKNYLFGKENTTNSEWKNSGNEFKNPYFTPTRFAITDEQGNTLAMPQRNDSEIWIRIEGEVEIPDIALTIGYAIYSENGHLLYWSYQTDVEESKWTKLEKGRWILQSQLPKRFLNEGTYRVEFTGGLHFREWLFEPNVNAPSIYITITGGLSDSPYWIMKRPGLLAPIINWNIQKCEG